MLENWMTWPLLGAARPDRARPLHFSTTSPWPSWRPMADGRCPLSPHLCCCFSCIKEQFSEYNRNQKVFLVPEGTGVCNHWYTVGDVSWWKDVMSRNSCRPCYPEGEMENEVLLWRCCPCTASLSLPVPQHTPRDQGLCCLREGREAVTKCKGNWKYKGWEIFLPSILLLWAVFSFGESGENITISEIAFSFITEEWKISILWLSIILENF